MSATANDNTPDTRLPVPLWRDAGHWFSLAMVAALCAIGLLRSVLP